MLIQPNQPLPSPFPLHELEQIETAINASQALLITLQSRQALLLSELDLLTRPPFASQKPLMRWISPGVEYKGTTIRAWNYIDIYTAALQRLWADHPDHRDAMAQAMASCGTTRCYVAKSITELFPGHSTSWAWRHSRNLEPGWFVDTNVNLERMRRVLPAAVAAAGLQFGRDVKVTWRSSRVPV